MGGFTNILLLNNYFLFYLALIMSLALLMSLSLKESFEKHLSRITNFFPIIWIAPIIDLFVSRGACMAYVGDTGTNLLVKLFTFFGSLPIHCGITIGIRIEILLIVIGTLVYVYKKTRNWAKSILLAIGTYIIIFAHLALPGIIGTLFNLSGPQSIMDWIAQSLIQTIHTPIGLTGTLDAINQIAIFASRPSWIISVALTITIFILYKKDLFVAWIKNTRLSRTIYYLAITGSGLAAASIFHKTSLSLHPLDISAYLILGILVITNWWLAVVINDLEDESLDSINSPDRPLVSKQLTRSNYYGLLVILSGVLITGATLINWNTAIMLLLFQLSYATYSMHPTYFKRHFLSSSLMVGLAGTATFLAGYFTLAPFQELGATPSVLILIVFITLALLSNAKDFKDIPGDKAHNIKTLPVLLGKRKAAFFLNSIWIGWLLTLGMLIHTAFIAYGLPWILLDFILKKRVPEYFRFILIIIQIISTPLLFT